MLSSFFSRSLKQILFSMETLSEKILSKHFFLFSYILFLGMSLGPYFFTSYYYDDMFLGLLNTRLEYKGIGLGTQLWIEISNYISLGLGRLIPVGSIIATISGYFFSNLWLYRFVHVGLIILSVGLASFGLFMFGLSRRMCFLFSILVMALFQMRMSHDALSSYLGFFQWLVIFGFLSIIFLRMYINNNRTTFLILSFLSITMGLLTYEMSFVFCLALILLAWHYRRSLLLPLCLFVIIYFILVFGLRYYSAVYHHSSGHPSLIPAAKITFFRALFHQTVGGLPLTHTLFSLSKKWFLTGFNVNLGTVLAGILMAIIGSFTALRALLKCKEDFMFLSSSSSPSSSPSFSSSSFLPPSSLTPALCSSSPNDLLFLKRLAWLLWLGPNFIIAVSGKYQLEIAAGVPYLPIYISYFGIALIALLYLIPWFLQKNNFQLRDFYKIAIVIGLILGVHLVNNVGTRKFLDESWKRPHQAMKHALEHGLIEQVPQGAPIKAEACDAYRRPWLGPEFIFSYTKKRLEVQCCENCYASSMKTQDNPEKGSLAPAPPLGKHSDWSFKIVAGPIYQIFLRSRIDFDSSIEEVIFTEPLEKPSKDCELIKKAADEKSWALWRRQF